MIKKDDCVASAAEEVEKAEPACTAGAATLQTCGQVLAKLHAESPHHPAIAHPQVCTTKNRKHLPT